MRAVVQRVQFANIQIGADLSDPKADSSHQAKANTVAEMGRGLLTLVGIFEDDTFEDAEWLMRKIIALRVFTDENDKMNLSLKDIGGTHLLVSQFTLCADTRKGNRPSFIEAARPEQALVIYNHALEVSRSLGVATQSGKFQADMKITLLNDGPVTLVLDSPSKKNPS